MSFYQKILFLILKKQDKPTQKRIVTAISKLPLEGDIKKLQGVEGYRLRVGNFRVLEKNWWYDKIRRDEKDNKA